MDRDSFEDPNAVLALAERIRQTTTRAWTIMEVCGGQTHAIFRYGINQLLPDAIRIVHGPGCPVCVTPIEMIDRAIEIASNPDVIFCTFGDMLRVPGTRSDLMRAKSLGADIRVIYSPLDACRIAQSEFERAHSSEVAQDPGSREGNRAMRQVVLFAIGFETTAPATALAIRTAKQKGWDHFSTLVSHVLVPPALHAIFSDPEHGIQGLLAAGHVCTITGYQDYFPIAERYRIPIAVTGFEPVDLLRGILNVIEQLEATPPSYRVDNLYEHVAMPLGNPQAQQVLSDVFEVSDQNWRGLGSLPKSGLHLRSDYAHLDALRRFPTSQPSSQLDSNAIDPNLNASILSHQSDCRTECQAADVLRGKLRPSQCPAFGTRCTPSNPLGAPMVSNEGACAAYYLYQPHSSEPNS